MSIRLRFVGWRFKCLDLLIDGVSKLLRHLVIKAESGDNSGLALQLPVRANPGTVGGQTHHVLTAPETARGNAINYQLLPFCQVNEKDFVVAFDHQSYPSSKNHPDLASLNAKLAGVEGRG